MPPKQSTLTQIHTYLQSTNTAHTLKDLEKLLPGVVSGLPSMLVKDHLSALVDEGLLLVEKIGSGNWYWTFGSAATREKKNALEKLLVEKEKLATAVADLREAVAVAGLTDGGETVGLIARVEELQKIRDSLAAEVEERSCVVADDAEVLRGKVNVYVDNLFVLEKYVLDVAGDREAVEGCRRMFGIGALESSRATTPASCYECYRPYQYLGPSDDICLANASAKGGLLLHILRTPYMDCSYSVNNY